MIYCYHALSDSTKLKLVQVVNVLRHRLGGGADAHRVDVPLSSQVFTHSLIHVTVNARFGYPGLIPQKLLEHLDIFGSSIRLLS